MRPEDLRDWLLKIPFRPFRMCLADGITFAVYHPEVVFVKRSTVDLYTTSDQPLRLFAERQVSIALLHIARLEAIPPAPSRAPAAE